MIPKQKAIEIYNKYITMPYPTNTDRAKQCALIAIDEIIVADWYIPTSEDFKKWTSYWQEVKQEIEKL